MASFYNYKNYKLMVNYPPDTTIHSSVS